MILLALILLSACQGNVGFTEVDNASVAQGGGDDQDGGGGGSPHTPSKYSRETESFVVQGQNVNAPLDLVWIIDNSGSMSEEAQQVESNLGKFIDVVKSKTDLRMAVVSAQSGPQGVRVPASATSIVKVVDFQVESWDALTLLAMSFCDDQKIARGADAFSAIPRTLRMDDLKDEEFCALISLQVKPPHIYHSRANRLIQNNLGDARFYRDDAAKAFVIVSDDDSVTQWTLTEGFDYGWPDVPWSFWINGISAKNFQSKLARRFPTQPYKVFSFIDPVGASKRPKADCGYVKGQQYLNLSSATKGMSFDICEQDWSKHFDHLIDSVVALAQNQFKLKHGSRVRQIVEVKINGTVVPPSMYALSSNGALELDRSVTDSAIGKTVQVIYEYL